MISDLTVLAGVLASGVVASGCGSDLTEEAVVEEYPALSDGGLRGVLTCTVVPAGATEEVLVVAAMTSSEAALPDDLRFTEIEATSAAGWDLRPVAVSATRGNMPMDWFLTGDPDPSISFTVHELPFAPDGVEDFGLAVVVEVPPAASTEPEEMNPPPAVTITGARYETQGEAFTWSFDHQMLVTRVPIDEPDSCARTQLPGTILDDD